MRGKSERKLSKRQGRTLRLSTERNTCQYGSSRQVNEIVLTDDDLRCLEKRFGLGVRQMGPWNSDGIFGYCGVPIAAVEQAACSLNDSVLLESIQELRVTQERTPRFMEILQQFGAALIQQIVIAYQQGFQMPGVSWVRSATEVA